MCHLHHQQRKSNENWKNKDALFWGAGGESLHEDDSYKYLAILQADNIKHIKVKNRLEESDALEAVHVRCPIF